MAGGRNRASDSSDIWDIAEVLFFVGDASDEGAHYFSRGKVIVSTTYNLI